MGPENAKFTLWKLHGKVAFFGISNNITSADNFVRLKVSISLTDEQILVVYSHFFLLNKLFLLRIPTFSLRNELELTTHRQSFLKNGPKISPELIK